MPSPVDIAIIGAGAAGLAAGIFAAETNNNLQIVILDGAKTPGAKILVSGGGRCNVTNQQIKASDFHGNRKVIDRILRRFNEQATVQWFTSLGVPLQTETSGKLFPVSNKARTVLEALLRRCEELSVTLLTQHHVHAIIHQQQFFEIQHSQGELQTRHLILATGGCSLPKTGSDGSGWELAQHLGHSINPTYPALVPLLLDPSFFHADLSGISHDVILTTTVAGKTVARQTGNLLWTHFGISGPVVLDISRFRICAAAQEEQVQVQLHLNCFPQATYKEIEAWLIRTAAIRGQKTVQALLAERLPTRVATRLAQYMEPDISHLPVNRLQKETRSALVHVLTNLSLPVVGSRGWNFAEVTAGGIPLKEINPSTMASKKVSDLYLIGEILDCDGRIGGFNFQWAWSTGHIAGISAARSLKKEPS